MAKESKKAALSMEDRLDTALVPNWEQPYKVPANWCWTTVKTLCTLINGRAFKPSDWSETGLPIVRIQNLNNPEAEYNYYSGQVDPAHMLKGQELLFAWSGTPGTSFGAHIWWGNEAVLNQHIFKVLFDERCVDKTYLKYAINQQLEWLISVAHGGAGLQHVTKGVFESTPIPLPPLAEQQRIVDRIESLFAKLDEAKEKAQVVMDGFEDRKAAILHKAFTGELTAEWRRKKGINLDSWIMTTASNLFEYVTSGSRGWAQYYADDGAVFIRMGNLDHGTVELDLSDVQHVVLPDKAEGQRSLLRKGDILISITADVGMIGLVRDATFEGYINQHIALARPVQKESAEFIAWYLVSDQGFSQLREKQRGATKVGLGLDDIRSLSLKMPSKEEQDEILRIIGGLISKSTHAKEAAEQVIDQIDTMKKSILARAFRGGLGTNDPTDESAIELLKEILNIEKTPTKRAKAVVIPKGFSANLETELEKKIIRLFYQKDTKELPIKDIITVSSKTFDVLDCLRGLERRQLITKLENGNYRLMG